MGKLTGKRRAEAVMASSSTDEFGRLRCDGGDGLTRYLRRPGVAASIEVRLPDKANVRSTRPRG